MCFQNALFQIQIQKVTSMMEIKNLSKNLTNVLDKEQELVQGGGIVPAAALGFVGGFTGSLIGSSSSALETGAFGYPNLRNAFLSGLGAGFIGGSYAGFTGAALKDD
jgi:hypothetical protein